jgi:hypothetical protein
VKRKLIAMMPGVAAMSALAQAQSGGPQPKPTKADVQNVVQLITTDKVKTLLRFN